MKDITDYLEKEQVDCMMAAAKTCNFRDYLMLRTLWRTGCRVSELLSIKPSDLESHNPLDFFFRSNSKSHDSCTTS
ncbi:MAG: tyrosine-type recombinase/integrase [Halobacteriota archaeon]